MSFYCINCKALLIVDRSVCSSCGSSQSLRSYALLSKPESASKDTDAQLLNGIAIFVLGAFSIFFFVLHPVGCMIGFAFFGASLILLVRYRRLKLPDFLRTPLAMCAFLFCLFSSCNSMLSSQPKPTPVAAAAPAPMPASEEPEDLAKLQRDQDEIEREMQRDDTLKVVEAGPNTYSADTPFPLIVRNRVPSDDSLSYQSTSETEYCFVSSISPRSLDTTAIHTGTDAGSPSPPARGSSAIRAR